MRLKRRPSVHLHGPPPKHQQHPDLGQKSIWSYHQCLHSLWEVYAYCVYFCPCWFNLLSQGAPLLWLLIFGQKSVQWPQVFAHIRQYDDLWVTWKCSKTLDKMMLGELWTCWNISEDACNSSGEVMGRKPLMHLIEKHFGSKWHSGRTVCNIGPICFI